MLLNLFVLSSVNLLAFYALCHISCLYLHPYMLICLDPHALCYMPCFPMPFFLFLLYVDVRVTCSHACMIFFGYALLRAMHFMCLYPCYMVRSLSSHAYMLGFMFFYIYVLSFYMFMHTFLCLYV